MILLLFLCGIGLVTSNDDIMTADMTPDTGPEMDTVYLPGTSGGQWTEDEIDSTRYLSVYSQVLI